MDSVRLHELSWTIDCSLNRSPLHLEAELQRARGAHGIKLIRYSNRCYTTADKLSERGVRQRRIRIVQTWMVEDIESIQAEDQVKSLKNGESTLDRSVQCVEAWASDIVASELAPSNGKASRGVGWH
jgi:hypothetical protein